jgi:hypothetical protein
VVLLAVMAAQAVWFTRRAGCGSRPVLGITAAFGLAPPAQSPEMMFLHLK